MPRKPPEVIRYQVWYEGNDDNPDIKLGIHGVFDFLDVAIAQGKKAAAFFNHEKRAVTRMAEDGKKKEHVMIEKWHDKVNVWIEELKDGFYHRTLDAEGQPCEEKQFTEESSTPKASGKKSKSTSLEPATA